jgi:hypothetical protein
MIKSAMTPLSSKSFVQSGLHALSFYSNPFGKESTVNMLQGNEAPALGKIINIIALVASKIAVA